MSEKMDLRIIKTYSALTGALENLILEKPLNEITVSEICDKAMVRRATFYKHFGDKNELLVFMFKEMKTEIKKRQDEAYFIAQDIKRNFYRDIVVLFEYIEEKEPLFTALNNNRPVCIVFDSVTENITQEIKKYLIQNQNTSDVHSKSFTLMSQLLTGALLHGITWWLNHRDLFTKYEMAEQLSVFITDAIARG